jgi:hypothetical protein
VFVTSCDRDVRSKDAKMRQQSSLRLPDFLRVAEKFGNMKLRAQNKECVIVRIIIRKYNLVFLYII